MSGSAPPDSRPPARTMHKLAIVLSAFAAVGFVILIVLVLAMHDFMSALDPEPQPGYPVVTTPVTIVASEPDARIFVDGVDWGKPPVTIPAMSIGAEVELRAELAGHGTVVERVRITNPQPTVRLTLKPAP